MEQGQEPKSPDSVIGPRAVTIIVPTWNNLVCLHRCVNSMLQYTQVDPAAPHFHVLVVNNGDAGGPQRAMQPHQAYTVIESGDNLGWEGGLKKGMSWVTENTKSPFVLFANDDIQIVPNDWLWMDKMMRTMTSHEKMAVVGPTSNYVSGAQNFSNALDPRAYEIKMLIGFCMLVRVEALEAVGGIVTGLPGGDDHDLSLRMSAAGWRMAIQGDVYVHHWGEVTGKRVHKDYWNSLDQISATRNELIRRHGLKSYMAMLRFGPTPL